MTDHYLYQRAEAELRMAQRAVVPEAMKAHYELANRYLDAFYSRMDEKLAAEPATR